MDPNTLSKFVIYMWSRIYADTALEIELYYYT